MQVTPIDFTKISIPRNARQIVKPYIISWRSLHPFLRDEEASEKNLTLLCYMLSLEMKSETPRRIMVTRLHMRINSMRRELEMEKMLPYLND